MALRLASKRYRQIVDCPAVWRDQLCNLHSKITKEEFIHREHYECCMVSAAKENIFVLLGFIVMGTGLALATFCIMPGCMDNAPEHACGVGLTRALKVDGLGIGPMGLAMIGAAVGMMMGIGDQKHVWNKVRGQSKARIRRFEASAHLCFASMASPDLSQVEAVQVREMRLCAMDLVRKILHGEKNRQETAT